MAPTLFDAFVKAMEIDRRNGSIKPVIEENIYGIGSILVECFLLPVENPGVKESRILLIRKYCVLHPNEIFTILSANPELPFADSLIVYGVKKISENCTIMLRATQFLPAVYAIATIR